MVRYPEFRVFTRTFFSGFFLTIALAAALAHAADSQDVDAAWQTLVLAGANAGQGGDFKSSEELLLKAVALTDKFPPGDPRSGTTLNTLGLVYKQEKKYADADKAFEKALGILIKAYGPDSLDVGNVNFNIASVMLPDSHYENALPYIQRSKAIYDKILGADSVKSASALCLLGESYRNLKQFNEAEEPLKKCAAAQEASAGLENADLANALYNLALVYVHQGKYALAEPRLKLAAKIWETTSGITSPELADTLEALSTLLKSMGRDDEAKKDELMAAAIRRSAKK